ncbi:acetate--CoA ligase family protein [Saccharopolyspora sp. 5N102]|uniref:acetate--CoA ligase family protein n=1 Tax=Saccharopolyspora sp. 5N102 TaxID=3375155 RepID=UPI0037BA1FFE
MPLDSLFFPKAIGVIGLSARPGSWGSRVVEILRSGGFGGELYAVEPRNRDVDLPILDDLAESGKLLDVLVVAVPAEAAIEVIERARRGGVGAVVLFSSGFAEDGADGRVRQQRLREAAGDMPVLGPNCLGVISKPASANVTTTAYVARPAPPPGPVSLVSQSGAVGFVLASLLDARGVGFTYYASVGNEACLEVTDIGGYLVERPDVRVLGLYVEQIRDPEALERLGRRAVELGKRIVVLKAGASEAGQRATLSHTAAVAGDQLLFDALCRDAGIVVAEDDESFADLVVALQREVSLPPRPNIAVLSMSGGAGAIIADRLAALGAEVRPLSGKTRDRIEELELAGVASTDNPIDLGGQFYRSSDAFGQLLALLDEDPEVDGVVCCFTFGDLFPELYRDLAEKIAALDSPSWLVWACPPPGALVGTPPGVVFPSIAGLIRALPGVIRPAQLDVEIGEQDVSAAVELLKPHSGVVTEIDAREVLRELGVRYVDTAVAGEDLPPADRYVVKIDSPDAPHRARLGLVKLGVAASDVSGTCAELLARAGELGLAGARAVIQPQLAHQGEIAVGAVRDPHYGPALLIGPGGSRVEEAGLTRQVIRLPARPGAIARALADAAPQLSTVEFAAVLARLGELVVRVPALAELDINPLLLTTDGAPIAVDSLIVVSEEA